jgi:hypothetical protein
LHPPNHATEFESVSRNTINLTYHIGVRDCVRHVVQVHLLSEPKEIIVRSGGLSRRMTRRQEKRKIKIVQ